MAGDSKTLTIRLIGNSKSAVGALERTAVASDALGARLAKVSKGFKTVGGKLTSVGRSFRHRVTLPVVAAGVASMKMASDFNAAMTRVQTQAGASAKDVTWLSKRVLDLSGKTQQSPIELANAMYHLKSVGLGNVAAMKALKAATDMAAVGNADLEETTNAVAGAWRTGIKGAGNFREAVGTLNAIIGAGNMKMADLNDSMGTGFLASAKTFGLTLRDVGSALAVMTDEGIPADAAATRLRMSFSLLGAPSKAAEKQLKKIGLTGTDLAKRLRSGGIVGAIGLLKDHLKGLSKVKASQILSRAFGGGRSSSAIMTLLNNFDVLEKKEKQVAGSAGKFGAAVRKQAKTPQAQFKLLISTIEMLAIKIGDKLLPFAVKAAKAFNRFLTWIDKLNGPTKKLIGIFVLVAAAIGPVLFIVGMLASAIGALLTPVGLVVAVIAGLGAALAIAAGHSEGFRKVLSQVIGFFKSLLPGLKQFGQRIMAAVGPGLKQIGQLIETQLLPAFKKIAPILKPVAKFLLEMFGAALIGAIKGVIQVIKGVIQVVSGVISLIADLIHGNWKAAWHDLVNIVKGVLNILIGAFKVWWNGSVLAIFRHGLLSVLGLFRGSWKGILALAKGFIRGMEHGLKVVVKVLTAPFRAGFRGAMDYVKTGWKYIRGAFTGGVGGIKAVLRRILEVVTYPFRNAFSIARRIVSDGVSRVISFFRSLPGRIRSALGRVRGAVTGALSGAAGWLWRAGQNIILGLLRGIGSMIGQVKDKLRTLTNLIPSWKGPADRDKRLLEPAGKSIIEGFGRGLASRFGGVRKMLGGFTSSLVPSNRSMAALAGSGGSLGGSPSGGYLARSAGSQGVTVVVQVDGNVIGEKDFARRIVPTIRDGLVQIGKRNGGNIFGGV